MTIFEFEFIKTMIIRNISGFAAGVFAFDQTAFVEAN